MLLLSGADVTIELKILIPSVLHGKHTEIGEIIEFIVFSFYFCLPCLNRERTRVVHHMQREKKFFM
jgi:hypothetical protein